MDSTHRGPGDAHTASLAAVACRFDNRQLSEQALAVQTQPKNAARRIAPVLGYGPEETAGVEQDQNGRDRAP